MQNETLRQTQTSLEEANRKFRDFYDFAPVGFLTLTASGLIREVNLTAVRQLGVPRSHLIGKSFGVFIEVRDRDCFFLCLKRLFLEPGPHRYEIRLKRPDGEIFFARLDSVAAHDTGEEPFCRTSITDLSDLKQAEQKLEGSENLYRLLVNQIPALVFKGYADWSIDFFDDKIEGLTGYRKAEFDSRTLKWCDLILPEDSAEVQEKFIEALKTDRAYVREYRIRKKDGEIAWIQARGQICCDAAGQVDCVSGVFFDITAHKALEAQLLQAQKMEAVGRLAGGVAHDFNNLLMAIMGYGELIRASLNQDDPLYKYSDDILKATERAASLTQQLLAFSRRQVMQPQLLDLNRVLADLEKMLRRLIGEHIDLDIVAGADLGRVKADPGQIGQIIMNLAVNSRDAMPTGGRIILSTANIEFTASHECYGETVPPGGYVRLAVTDTGGGIDAETLTHIFEPFFTTKEMGKGTGLGLSMVYGIVRQNGGCIEVESRSGQGTTVKIYLPRFEAPVSAPKDTMTLADKLEGTETILVVEDEDALRTLLCRFFRLYGYNVMEARHGGEALLIGERHPGPIHLMVTDVVMPQMSGKELADRLAPLHPEMTVFFMSGYTDSDLTAYGAPESPQHFIPKPFRPMDLVKKVRDSLDAPPGGPADTNLPSKK
jgi:two-component system cell cycle sensor histidine kinase/response regulator CckA